MALWRIRTDRAAAGTLELANSVRYGTWGSPTITGSHPNSANGGAAYGDLGFRFLYVGEFDVQWDRELGLGLYYMHARHYAPAIGRFLTPDPDRTEANLYAYTANNPVTEIDPDGTCFIVCQLVVGAIIDTVVYLATEENASLGGLVTSVARGAVESAVNPLAKLNKVSKLADAATKVYSKISKATRVKSNVRYVGGAWRTPDGRFARNPNKGPSPSTAGRAGRQQRLRELGDDPRQPRHVRGWIKQERNQIARGKRSSIRVPRGYQLAHGRTTPARLGFSYLHSKLQQIGLHKLQHKIGGYK